MVHKKIMNSGVITESFAKMLVINEKNQALVLTISQYEGHPEKSFTPDLPGGQIEIASGETEKDGVIRETKEEAGITLDPEDVYLAYAETLFYPEKNKSVSGFLYIARLTYTPEIIISWEHAGYEWIPIADLLATKSFRHFHKTAIEYAVSHQLV